MRQRVTAIIKDKRGRILSIGKNSYVKTHPMQARMAKMVGHPAKVYLHAEIAAIVACKDLQRAHSIHVFRYGADGRPANAKPCEICRSGIAATNIKEIYHT